MKISKDKYSMAVRMQNYASVLPFFVLLLIFFALSPVYVKAQSHRIENAKMVGIGYQQVLDTYLSNEHFSGLEGRYLSHTVRYNDSTAWQRVIINEGSLSSTKPRSANGGYISGSYRFEYGILHSWKLLDTKLSLNAGAQADATLGFIYNTRGGNNTAQAQASINIGPAASASYKIRGVTVGCHLSAPLVGFCFSPNYGQSYYEIFVLKNTNHNLCPTTFIATPSLRSMISADFQLFNTTWRVGWLADIRQQNVNNIKQHIYTNEFVIGIVRNLFERKINK